MRIHRFDGSAYEVPAVCTYYGISAPPAVIPYGDASIEEIDAAWRTTPAYIRAKISEIVDAARNRKSIETAQAEICRARKAEQERQAHLKPFADAWDVAAKRAASLRIRIARAEKRRAELAEESVYIGDPDLSPAQDREERAYARWAEKKAMELRREIDRLTSAWREAEVLAAGAYDAFRAAAGARDQIVMRVNGDVVVVGR